MKNAVLGPQFEYAHCSKGAFNSLIWQRRSQGDPHSGVPFQDLCDLSAPFVFLIGYTSDLRRRLEELVEVDIFVYFKTIDG